MLQPLVTPAAEIKPMINVGACFDVPTGYPQRGSQGQVYINGGCAFTTGVVGPGNVFKSTTADFFMLRCMARVRGPGTMYDTEISKHAHRLTQVAQAIAEWDDEAIIDTGRLIITDKTVYSGDQYWDLVKDFMVDKKKNAAAHKVTLPFMLKNGQQMTIIEPTFQMIDSFSEFATSGVAKIQDENDLGDSGTNMLHMRSGRDKSNMLMELPGLAGGSYTYWFLTGHIGDEFNLDPRKPQEKKMADLPQGKKFKGLPEKFTFQMNNCWLGMKVQRLINDSTKAPEFPRDQDDDTKGDTDLNVVMFKQLRGKSGPTGMPVFLVISQSDGVLPSLTEFYNIKENDRFGLGGNVQNYFLELYPDAKLSRTTVRRKIDSDVKLCRAINITSEMQQMQALWHAMHPMLKALTPKGVYDTIKALGYDWDQLLGETRGWWAPVGLHEDLKELSTVDVMRMALGWYIPFWMENPPAAAIELYNSKHVTPWKYGQPQLEESSDEQ
jgi:hypothetical protein